jgi:hypothetical protein
MWTKWNTWKTEEIINNLSPDSKLTNTNVEKILKEFSSNIESYWYGNTVPKLIERLNSHFMKNQKQIVQYCPIALFCYQNIFKLKTDNEKLGNDLVTIMSIIVDSHYETLIKSSSSYNFSHLIIDNLPRYSGRLDIDSIFSLIEMSCYADSKSNLVESWKELFHNQKCSLKAALNCFEDCKPKFKYFKVKDEKLENHLFLKMLLEIVSFKF